MNQTEQIAILAYGSLLAHPGDWFGKKMDKLVRYQTPFGVEYLGQANDGRGGAPTLVRSDDHRPIMGGLIVLNPEVRSAGLQEVKARLAERERVKPDSKSIKSDLKIDGYIVVYSDFPRKLEPDVDQLARAARDSVAKCYRDGHAFMNGIRYLRENLEWGVETGLSQSYQEALLRLTAASSLEDAEHRLLAAAKQSQDAVGSGGKLFSD
jgi:hypothetical protein